MRKIPRRSADPKKQQPCAPSRGTRGADQGKRAHSPATSAARRNSGERRIGKKKETPHRGKPFFFSFPPRPTGVRRDRLSEADDDGTDGPSDGRTKSGVPKCAKMCQNAPNRFAWRRSSPFRIVPHRSASFSFVPHRFASFRFMPLCAVPHRFASFRSAPKTPFSIELLENPFLRKRRRNPGSFFFLSERSSSSVFRLRIPPAASFRAFRANARKNIDRKPRPSSYRFFCLSSPSLRLGFPAKPPFENNQKFLANCDLFFWFDAAIALSRGAAQGKSRTADRPGAIERRLFILPSRKRASTRSVKKNIDGALLYEMQFFSMVFPSLTRKVRRLLNYFGNENITNKNVTNPGAPSPAAPKRDGRVAYSGRIRDAHAAYSGRKRSRPGKVRNATHVIFCSSPLLSSCVSAERAR